MSNLNLDLSRDPCTQYHYRQESANIGGHKQDEVAEHDDMRSNNLLNRCLFHWTRLTTGGTTASALVASQYSKNDKMSSLQAQGCNNNNLFVPFGAEALAKRSREEEGRRGLPDVSGGGGGYSPVTLLKTRSSRSAAPQKEVPRNWRLNFSEGLKFKEALPPVQLVTSGLLPGGLGGLLYHGSAVVSREHGWKTATRYRLFPATAVNAPTNGWGVSNNKDATNSDTHSSSTSSSPRWSQIALSASWTPKVIHSLVDKVESCLHLDAQIVHASQQASLKIGFAQRDVWNSTMKSGRRMLVGDATEGWTCFGLLRLTDWRAVDPRWVVGIAPVVGSFSEGSYYYFLRLSAAVTYSVAHWDHWRTTFRLGLVTDLLQPPEDHSSSSNRNLIPSVEKLPTSFATASLGRAPATAKVTSLDYWVNKHSRSSDSNNQDEKPSPITTMNTGSPTTTTFDLQSSPAANSILALNIEVERKERLSCYASLFTTELLSRTQLPSVGLAMGYTMRLRSQPTPVVSSHKPKQTPVEESGDWRSYSVFRFGGRAPLFGDELATRVECRYSMDLVSMLLDSTTTDATTHRSGGGGGVRKTMGQGKEFKCGVTWSLLDIAD